uniref:Uncharacterized protein n=1 Tax=Cacopsylla melanoneura TaxID=428564 RepID=A0A8D8YY54_9HEMI
MRRFLLAAPVGVDPLSALFVSSSDATRLRRLSAHFLPLALLPFPGVDDLSLSFPNDCFPVSLLDDFVVLDDSFDLLNLEFDAPAPPLLSSTESFLEALAPLLSSIDSFLDATAPLLSSIDSFLDAPAPLLSSTETFLDATAPLLSSTDEV